MYRFNGIVDRKGRVQFVSRGAPGTFGDAPEEMLRKPFWDAPSFRHSEESRQKIRQAVLEALDGEEVVCRVEASVRDGTVVPVDFTMSPLKGMDGDIVGIVGEVEFLVEEDPVGDPEVRRGAAGGLFEIPALIEISRHISDISGYAVSGSELYRVLAENMTEVVWIADLQGKMVYVSPSVERQFGYSPEEVLRLGFEDMMVPESLELVRTVIAEEFTEAVVDGWEDVEPRYLELQFVAKDGVVSWIEATVTLLRDQGGQVIGIMGVSRDIGERRQVEDSLRQSEALQRQIIDNVKDVFWTVDANLQFTYVSPSVTSLTGKTVEEAMAQSLMDAVAPSSRENAMGLFMKAFEAGGRMEEAEGEFEREWISYEVETLHKEGYPVWTENRVGFLYDPEGRPVGFIGSTRDIRERKQAEQELAASQAKLQEALERLRVSYDELSTPVIQVWDQVLAVPLIGVLDTHRASQIMEVLLRRIVEAQARVVIVDVTGVATMDTMVTNHLVQTAQAAGLLGTDCVITGIKPDVAQAMVQIGVDMTELATCRDLQEGLRYALGKMGYVVRAREG